MLTISQPSPAHAAIAAISMSSATSTGSGYRFRDQGQGSGIRVRDHGQGQGSGVRGQGQVSDVRDQGSGVSRREAVTLRPEVQILTVDVGTGTQDILLFDSDRELENCFKLVLPSPTVVAADRIRGATAQRRRLVLRGVTMGGGPCHWAAMDHVRAGLATFATPEAARTFDDDLDAVAGMGIQIVSDDEAIHLADAGAEVIVMRDLALAQVLQALASFGVNVKLSALAVAVFDHGAAPPGFSDRVFRFNYLGERLAAGLGLAGFAFSRENIPLAMTRLQAVAATAPADLPLLVMDTAPAAVLGALEDPRVRSADSPIVANDGHFHCLAFHLLVG